MARLGAVRLVTQDGDVLQLIVPTVQIEGMITALRQAKNAAIAKLTSAEQPDNETIFTPRNYATMVTADYPGVLLAFDRDAPSKFVIGLDTNSAKNIGMDLRKQARQVESRPKLIVPSRG